MDEALKAMVRPEAVPLSSSRPDLRVLAVLGVIHRILVALVIAIGAIYLCGWLVPYVGHILPSGKMKANSALLILLCGVSILLSEPQRSKISTQLSRLLAGLATLLAAILVFERITGITLRIDTLLAADADSPFPGRVSIEACGTLLLVGFVLLNLRARKRFLSHVVDGVTLCIVLSMLTLASRYAFGITHMFEHSLRNPMAPLNFLCVGILTWLVVNRRAEYGALSILIGGQIGAKTTRYAAPCAILLPFVFAFTSAWAVRIHLLTSTVANATATSTLSVFAFVLVLVLGSKTNQLESAIRELSLRDELTGLYNRRGFYVLAEQALRLAQRAGESFFALFIDVDGLKKTNDELGHEVGSELLRSIAGLIEHTFRETDVIGRIGGDEFVIAGRVDAQSMDSPVRRLEQATALENSMPGRPFSLNFSFGCVLADETESASLDQLIEKADGMMYQAKRTKKQHRLEPVEVHA
jgi:diguanylate cyclase (GGDEF)-like protein